MATGLSPEEMLRNYLQYGYSGATSWRGEGLPSLGQTSAGVTVPTNKTAEQILRESGIDPERIVERYARTGSTGVFPNAPSAPVDIEMWIRQNWQLVAITLIVLLILRR